MTEVKHAEETVDLQHGLSHEQVAKRVAAGYVNVQNDRITKSYQEIFKDNLFTLFNLINAILAGMIIFIGSYKNLLFLGVVLSNLVIGLSLIHICNPLRSLSSRTSKIPSIFLFNRMSSIFFTMLLLTTS